MVVEVLFCFDLSKAKATAKIEESRINGSRAGNCIDCSAGLDEPTSCDHNVEDAPIAAGSWRRRRRAKAVALGKRRRLVALIVLPYPSPFLQNSGGPGTP